MTVRGLILQIQACHRSFIRLIFMLPSPLMLENKTAPAQNLSCARADKTNLWCHLACRCYVSRPLCREPTFPCSVTGAARQRILWITPFPRALREPLCCPALRPIPSNRGSLWLRCQLYFRFIGLKHLYHTCGRLSTPNFIFYSASAVSGEAMLFLSSTNSFCTCSPTGASASFSRQRLRR